MIDMTKRNYRKIGEGFGPSGPFSSDPDSFEIIANPEEKKTIRKSKKAPTVQARKQAKALSARGQAPKLNPNKLQEYIRKPIVGTLTAEYEIVDDDGRAVGFASIQDGVIETLDFIPSPGQSYRGEILSALLSQIVADADRSRANLSIDVQLDGETKLTLERFGFRLVQGSVMKRGFGSIRPPSVPGTPGLAHSE